MKLKLEGIKFRPQNEFPLLEEFKKKFPIDNNTIFALGDTIYSNNNLPDHLIAHELKHLEQQAEYGIKEWFYDYLEDPKFRLEQEVAAYRIQLKTITSRDARCLQRQLCIRDLSGPLYGNLLTREQIEKLI